MSRQEELFKQTLIFFSNVMSKADEFRKDLNIGELTKVQYSMLELLYFHGPTTPTQINHCLSFNMPNTSRELTKLVAKQLITKTYDQQDRRKVVIELTDHGRELMLLAIEQIKGTFFASTPNYSEEEINALIFAIRTIQAKML